MIVLGLEQLHKVDEALAREWLVANGLGGYAAASLTGTPTRRYHGLLVAALHPPSRRTVLLSQCEELLTYTGRPYLISTTEYEDGTFAPAGYVHLKQFRLERGLPVAIFEIGDTTIEKRCWMAHGRNTTHILYRLPATARGPVELRLRPLISGRPHHLMIRGGSEPGPRATLTAEGCAIDLARLGVTLRLRLTDGIFEAQPDWYWRVLYRRERERGPDYCEDLFSPGTLVTNLVPGGEVMLTISIELPERIETDPSMAWQLEWLRRGELLSRAGQLAGNGLGQTLTLAADTFLTTRAASAAGQPEPPRSIIAGYPWLGERGRDLLIGLPGLTLVTGRTAEARSILKTLLTYRRDGRLPSRFNEENGQPEYAGRDSGLWFFIALRAYLNHTGDNDLLTEVGSALIEITDTYRHGHDPDLTVDSEDGLLQSSDTASEVTWLGIQAGDHGRSLYQGKPVDLNALWYNVLCLMAEWSAVIAPERGHEYALAAQQVETSFNRLFWHAPTGHLYDVIEGETGHDLSLRPSQILAIGLPFPVLGRARWRPVLDAVTDHLLTPFGLRTLSPIDPAYVGWYAGDTLHRDRAYYHGTIWPWLLGPYCDAHFRVYKHYGTLRDQLQAFERHLRSAGLGFISELFDADAPYSPQGCIAQAASVGEVLRVWSLVNRPITRPPLD